MHSVAARGAHFIAVAPDTLFESLDGGLAWREIDAPLAALAGPRSWLAEVAIDTQKRVWLCGAGRVFVRRDRDWHTLPEPPSEAPGLLRSLGRAYGSVIGRRTSRTPLRPIGLHPGEQDIVVATTPSGAMRWAGETWFPMTGGLEYTPGPRGYTPRESGVLAIARRDEVVAAASHSGVYVWSVMKDCWERIARPFVPLELRARTPEWVVDLARLSSTLVRGFVPSPWERDEWLVAGDAGIAAVRGGEVRMLWSVSRDDPSGLITSMAVAKDAVWVGFHRARPEGAVLVLQRSGARFLELPRS